MDPTKHAVITEKPIPEEWLDTARRESVTHAFLVPTMLARIVHLMEADPGLRVPSLRNLVYGGARMPAPVLERALALFPDTDFVNAYGLTETSSTVALLGPDDHRLAMYSDDPVWTARLSSVGQPIPGIEVNRFSLARHTGLERISWAMSSSRSASARRSQVTWLAMRCCRRGPRAWRWRLSSAPSMSTTCRRRATRSLSACACGVGSGRAAGCTASAKRAMARASRASVLASCPVARAKSRI